MIAHPFVFRGREDFIINVGQVAVDLSDGVNPSNFRFPENYHSPHCTGDQALPTWQGIYLRNISMLMPEKFRRNTDEPLQIAAPYVLIDRQGLTTHIYASGVLPLGQKSANGWAFAVDSVELKITANQFEVAKLTGLINVPLLASARENCDYSRPPSNDLTNEDCLVFRAVILRGNNYLFGVENQSSYCVNVWQSQLMIEPNSRLDLSYVNNRFVASATLYGGLDINAGVGNLRLTASGIGFAGLVLTTEAPYFQPGTWSFPSAVTATVGQFSLGFNQIYLAQDSVSTQNGSSELTKIALCFQTSLELEGEVDLDARGSFRLLGYLEEINGRQRYRFRKLKMDAFRVEGGNDAFRVSAAIAFYEDDPAWGTGFYGAGSLFLTALAGGDVGIAAVAQFGQLNGERYFFVDVMARLGNGIPIGAIKLMAAGGGIYKGMSRRPTAKWAASNKWMTATSAIQKPL
ncbi:MAG: hypothetical protein HC821_05165 [Lewinella sp.]|nr:hypothetical protein [Lewinella sp.]